MLAEKFSNELASRLSLKRKTWMSFALPVTTTNRYYQNMWKMVNQFKESLEKEGVSPNAVQVTWASWDCPLDGRPIIQFETPLITRCVWREPPSYEGETQHFRIAINNPACFNQAIYNLPSSPDSGRYFDLLKRCSQILKPMRIKEGGYILYVLQMPGDHSLGKVNQFRRSIDDLKRIKELTTKKVLIVIHPNYKSKLPWYVKQREMGKKDFAKMNIVAEQLHYQIVEGPSFKYFDGCDLVVTYSSGTGYEALQNGIPVIALLRESYVYDICSNSIDDIAGNILINEQRRNEHFFKLAYCEWSLPEVKSGIAARHLLPILAH